MASFAAIQNGNDPLFFCFFVFSKEAQNVSTPENKIKINGRLLEHVEYGPCEGIKCFPVLKRRIIIRALKRRDAAAILGVCHLY